MPPSYFFENRYSFVVDALPKLRQPDHEVETPETAFEREVQQELALANRLLIEGRHGAALEKYRYLRSLIAKLLHPPLRVREADAIDWARVDRAAITDSLIAKSAELLVKTPLPRPALPPVFMGTAVDLPDEILKTFSAFEQAGVSDDEGSVGVRIQEAVNLVRDGAFEAATELMQATLRQTRDAGLRAALLHDVAIVQERSGNRDTALATMQNSLQAFTRVEDFEAQATVLEALAGVQSRGGDDEGAAATQARAGELRDKHNLFAIGTPDVAEAALVRNRAGLALRPGIGTPVVEPVRPPVVGPVRPPVVVGPIRPPVIGPVRPPIIRPRNGEAALTATLEAAAIVQSEMGVQLLAAGAYAQRATVRRLTLFDGAADAHTITLDGARTANLEAFYGQLATTTDVTLLMGYLRGYATTIAYLPHVFGWVLPMAIGDCHAALGSYAEAEREYLSTLQYRHLNTAVEAVNLWLRLAELYADWGDRLYRDAGNTVAEFAAAKEKYELILRLDDTLDNGSPLYSSPVFAQLRTRVGAAIDALFVSRTASSENPRVQIVLRRARVQLSKIAGELNYLGIGVHTPPFSFEYLQTLARYFAQHASQVEQAYIQFQSTGESEQLREQQMAQQVALTAASVELEERGLAEAQEGVDVAEANRTHAQVQVDNANQAANDFAGARWELLELDTLTAWANASAVDRDDQVKLSISGYAYYSASSKRRNVVLKELAAQRTLISHDLESARLDREIASAAAYREVARQQVQQAEARAEVAEQRVRLAELQHQYAQENLTFLDGREFASAMWYNLAREARRLAGRYLDVAIEVATMMERAYLAETGRDLRKVKFEYGLNHLNGLLGAEALLLDVDYFTLDHVRTKSKRAPMRQTISLADGFPMAFNRLLNTGTTYFETTLEHFDRRYPGFYLQKVKQVEVVFVGLGGSEGAHGTLRNIGVSQFRRKTGEIVNQVYPADVMPLSDYDVRRDAIVFQLDGKELRLFENNGVATMWQLDLPQATNTFDLRQILDVQLVVYYDGFFDAGLESAIRAALPSSGSASRALSLQLYAPDELFFLRSQGSCRLEITPDLFPANQTHHTLTGYVIQARGADVDGLEVQVELESSQAGHVFTLGADGTVDGAAFTAPIGQNLMDTWTLTIDPAANVEDVAIFVEYDFDLRS
jgi:hypothetical protein